MESLSKFSEILSELMFYADNMTSQQLATAINVTDRTVNRWKSGEEQISFSNLIKVANFFKCSLDFLSGRKETKLDFIPKECPPFYERLRAVMKENDVSWYKLVRKTTIRDNHLYQWKRGSEPQIPALIELANYFDVSIDYLVGRER